MPQNTWLVRLNIKELNERAMYLNKNSFLITLLFALLVFASCSDDKKIFFTRNMIISDIVTDKEVQLVDNDIILNVFTGEEINIHGEEGRCTVLTEDTTVAQAVVYDSGKGRSLIIYPRREGSTSITVTDSQDNSSTLYLTVKPAEQTRVNSQCGYIIQTDDKADSLKISRRLNTWQNREYLINFTWKTRKSGVAAISTIDRKGVFNGAFSLYQERTDNGLQSSLILYNPVSNLVYATYKQDLQHPNCYIKDLTRQFRAQYKGVKKVQLILQLNEVH